MTRKKMVAEYSKKTGEFLKLYKDVEDCYSRRKISITFEKFKKDLSPGTVDYEVKFRYVTSKKEALQKINSKAMAKKDKIKFGIDPEKAKSIIHNQADLINSQKSEK